MTIPIAPPQSYCIAFDTKSTLGFIRAVKVTLETDMIAPDDEKHRVDLKAHPLYSHLKAYVKANP